MNISVLGCGRWASFIAWYLTKTGHDTVIWGRPSSKNFIRLSETRANDYLTLDDRTCLNSDLGEAVAHAELIVISIESQQLRDLAQRLKDYPIADKTIILCMKGIEEATCMRLTEVIADVLGPDQKTAVWLGPGHVEEFVKGHPSCMVIDSADTAVRDGLVEAFSSKLIRFYYGTDIIGSEIGAAAKNVIGIAAGMLDGLEFSSLKGALMARGVREVSRLIVAMGGKELTAYGLTHLGDYEATVFSQHSRNRKYGECFIKNEPFTFMAEGVSNAAAFRKLMRGHGVEMPICASVYSMLYEKADPHAVLENMFMRSLKDEFY